MRAKQEVIIKARDIAQYLRLRAQGWRTVWVGDGKICMVKGGAHAS